MNTYQYYPINIEQKLFNKNNKGGKREDSLSQENDHDFNALEFSASLIIKDDESPHKQQSGSIYITLSTSKTSISPNEHKTSSKTQGISLDINNTTTENKNNHNNTFSNNKTSAQEGGVYSNNNNNNNSDALNTNNFNKQQNLGSNKKAKKDLDNSYTSLSLGDDEDDDVDMNALNGSSRSNLALDLLASKDDNNMIDGCEDMEMHLGGMIGNQSDSKKKKKTVNIQKPIQYILPDSQKVKKVELFVLPLKVNSALLKNKSSPIFCPIHEPKYEEFLHKVSLKEFKLMAKEGPKIPKTWPDKLKAFPSATTYYAYAKNRYRDVLANEESRVRLKGVEQDYINANHIKPVEVFGRKVRGAKRYIACQAPIPTTLNDFWMMMWQQKACVIVMLTKFTEKGVKKANSYWPKRKGETNNYGDFKVSNKGFIELDNITITFLELDTSTSVGIPRIVYHLHYTEWPDFGVPTSTLILRNLITFTDLYSHLGSTRDLNGPIICHCSAGIGRTGTFIATHLSLSLWKAEEEKPNVYEIVKKLRELRSGMVQSDSQYLFIYKVFNDYIYLSNHPKKSQRYSSLNSISLISDELRSEKRKKKAFLKKSNSLANLHSLK